MPSPAYPAQVFNHSNGKYIINYNGVKWHVSFVRPGNRQDLGSYDSFYDAEAAYHEHLRKFLKNQLIKLQKLRKEFDDVDT